MAQKRGRRNAARQQLKQGDRLQQLSCSTYQDTASLFDEVIVTTAT